MWGLNVDLKRGVPAVVAEEIGADFGCGRGVRGRCDATAAIPHVR